MNIIIGIDDTDNIESKGTGHLAEAFCKEIERNELGKCFAITRHQLYVHEDIPYTSHNSAMCFEMVLTEGCFDKVVELGQHILKTESAEGSDPGLCVAVLDSALNRRHLERFGRDAQKKVLTKNDAYLLAKSLGIHLSEHGGTGQGIIGSMAGVGLRLSGNDGRYRGWYHLGLPGKEMTVKDLCSYDFIDTVKSRTGKKIDEKDTIVLGDDKIKTVLLGNEQVVLVSKDPGATRENIWITLTKQEVKEYDNSH